MSERWNAEFKSLKINPKLHRKIYRIRDLYRRENRRNITADAIIEFLVNQDPYIISLMNRTADIKD